MHYKATVQSGNSNRRPVPIVVTVQRKHQKGSSIYLLLILAQVLVLLVEGAIGESNETFDREIPVLKCTLRCLINVGLELGTNPQKLIA